MRFNWNLKPEESVVRFDPKDTLILVALQAELPREMIPSWNVAYTGVGKVNAALKGSEYVARYKPINLINFGTAGALNPKLSGLLEVTQFFQRDMDARDMGFALGFERGWIVDCHLFNYPRPACIDGTRLYGHNCL